MLYASCVLFLFFVFFLLFLHPYHHEFSFYILFIVFVLSDCLAVCLTIGQRRTSRRNLKRSICVSFFEIQKEGKKSVNRKERSTSNGQRNDRRKLTQKKSNGDKQSNRKRKKITIFHLFQQKIRNCFSADLCLFFFSSFYIHFIQESSNRRCDSILFKQEKTQRH